MSNNSGTEDERSGPLGDEDDLRVPLRTTDELRADCLRLLGHDINNPLTAIRILSEMLRDEIRDPLMRRDVIDILEAADLAGALIDGMNSLVLLEGQSEECTWFPIDLVDVLRQAVDRPALRRHIRFELPREILMMGDRAALHRAFTDVFVNARRLVDGTRDILVRAREDGDEVEVRVQHQGQGIPVALRPHMFRMFGAVTVRESRIPVTAMGLVYAAWVIDVHAGTITFAEGEEGMDLVIRIPR